MDHGKKVWSMMKHNGIGYRGTKRNLFKRRARQDICCHGHEGVEDLPYQKTWVAIVDQTFFGSKHGNRTIQERCSPEVLMKEKGGSVMRMGFIRGLSSSFLQSV